MDGTDYYQALGVEETASQDEIKKAYRRLARKYHPDVSKEENAEERFKTVSEAYETLKDEERRKEYDHVRQYGYADKDWQDTSDWGSRTHYHQGNFDDVEDVNSFFESLFGRSRRAEDGSARGYQFSMDGDDVHYRMAVSLSESYHGVKRLISFEIAERDEKGHAVRKSNKISVTIPKGVINGQQLRLKGKGNPGISGGKPGDLYLEIEIETHPLFHVEGRDISIVLPVSPWEIALGESVEVPTLGAPKKMKIPSNARSGQKIRLKGEGLPGKQAGDLFVILQVYVPQPKNDSDRKLFEKMKQQMPFNPRENLKVS